MESHTNEANLGSRETVRPTQGYRVRPHREISNNNKQTNTRELLRESKQAVPARIGSIVLKMKTGIYD